MTEVNTTLFFLIVACSSLLGIYFYGKRSWLGLALVVAFLSRVFVATLLQHGFEYDFVQDGLGYEYRAWLLAQKWVSRDIFYSLTSFSSAEVTLYDRLLGYFFEVFGRDTLLATMMNSFFATASIYFIYQIGSNFLGERSSSKELKLPVFISSLLLVLYPSFLIWSATNIRDPLYFLMTIIFFYFFLTIVSRRSRVSIVAKFGSLFGCIFSFWVVLDLRPYVAGIFLGSIALSLIIAFLARWVRAIYIMLGIALLGGISIYAFQAFEPEMTGKLLSIIGSTRLGFANLNLLDSVAKSSFALDHPFNSVTDLLTFLPISLGHYFFGPYPWEISDAVQAISFVETLIVYFLVYPTLLGVRSYYKNSRFETIVILTFVSTFVMAQSFIISNMGTIFRHRSLPFMFLSLFAGEGLYEIGKKHFSTLFKTKRWRAFTSRRQPIGGFGTSRL